VTDQQERPPLNLANMWNTVKLIQEKLRKEREEKAKPPAK